MTQPMRTAFTVDHGSRPSLLRRRALGRGARLAIALAVLLAGVPASAQPAIDIRTTPPPETPKPPPPQPERAVEPGTVDPGTGTGPYFLGPTGETKTGRYGASVWTAPSPSVGGAQAGGRHFPGHLGFGFSYTWGESQSP